MQTAIWMIFGAVLGAGCGCGALAWAYRLLRSRKRQESLPCLAERLIVLAAAVCGGTIGFYSRAWLPMIFTLALLTVGIAVAVPDWLCRIIPNPTVLAVFALKLLLIAGALLGIPGVPSFSLLSSLGGMVCCFVIFSLPGLMGKQVGAGDIKLAAAVGFLLGFSGALLAIVCMGVLMLGYCVVQQRMPLLKFLKTNIPMGPFIAAGMVIAYLVPCITL